MSHDRGRMTRFNPFDDNSTPDLSSRCFSGGNEGFLHFRVGKGKSRGALLSGRGEVARAGAHLYERDLVGASGLERIKDAEFSCFRDAPRCQHFTAYTIP